MARPLGFRRAGALLGRGRLGVRTRGGRRCAAERLDAGRGESSRLRSPSAYLSRAALGCARR
jgi:hypothetical protein